MLRVIQVGLGPIGRGIAERAGRVPALELVGAVDPGAGLAGRDLGELLGQGRLGIEVLASIEQALRQARPDLVLHATGSRLDAVADQLLPILRRGIAVISTCEELAYPFYRHPELSRSLDSEAAKAGTVLLGTGVNPGFVMDKLVATLLASCDSVRAVRVSRIVDAATRREPFQRKIGAGLTPAEFDGRRRNGGLGHVGLAESAHMLADVIGLGPRRELRERLRPVVAGKRVASDCVEVEAGQVAGIDQAAAIEEDGVERVRLELQMFLGAPSPRDAVSVDGSPPLEMAITSGIPGDQATGAVVLSCAPLVRALQPGLRTMLDVPVRPPTVGGVQDRIPPRHG